MAKRTRYIRNYSYQKRYGITLADYEKMIEDQEHRCGTFFVDHDHVTGKVRGLLCNRCNRVLGYSKDNLELLQTMIDYLKKER